MVFIYIQIHNIHETINCLFESGSEEVAIEEIKARDSKKKINKKKKSKKKDEIESGEIGEGLYDDEEYIVQKEYYDLVKR